MKTSKSVLTVARVALAVSEKAYRSYSHRFSPKIYTQPQLVACLVLREYLRLDYRAMSLLLREWSDLRDALNLTRAPHFTTLCTAARRLTARQRIERLLGQTLNLGRQARMIKKRIKHLAIDSTGLASRHVSSYFTKRCGRHGAHYKRRYPKLSAACDCRSHLMVAAVVDRGPSVDYVEFEELISRVVNRVEVDTLLADAGYESERIHQRCRDELGIRSVIPTTCRGRLNPDGKRNPPRGHYRHQLWARFPHKTYGHRWQIETVFSMFKRLMGDALRSRSYWAQCRETMLRVVTHNIMILCYAR